MIRRYSSVNKPYHIFQGVVQEVVVLTNSKDTSKAEEALATTSLINWHEKIYLMPYSDYDVINIRRNLSSRIGLRELPFFAAIKHFLDKSTKPFDDMM